MRTWLRIITPPILWCAYVVDFPFLHAHLGDQTRLLALALVAASAWVWGVAGGLANAALGLLLGDGLLRVLHGGTFGLPQIDAGDGLFKLITFVGAGLGFGYLRRMQTQIDRHRVESVQAQFDPLTGVLTRQAFEDRLATELDCTRERGGGLAVLFVDLDRFKFVNDTYGHEIGDALLRQVGRVLLDNVRDGDLVGRIGGDEFTVALLDMRDTGGAAAVARTLVRVLGQPFVLDGHTLHISASVGISLFPRDGETVEALTRHADSAMYEVKEGGKNAFHFSSVEMRSRVSRRLELEQQLRRGIAEQEFTLVYQPQVELATGRLVAFEALIRWHSPELGLVSPGEFIPVAEESGYIGPLGQWLMREACFQLRSWQQAGLDVPRMAVNVSTLQFRQFGFIDSVRGALDDSGINPRLLEIEITESVLLKEYQLAVDTVTKLARLGVRTALDDFGTGYSSLAYLQRLPIASLKIDQSFVMGLHHGPARSDMSAMPIVEAIVAMAHKLDKVIVAEGVETEAQRRFLASLGVDYAQGFHFSKPLTVARAERLLHPVTPTAMPVPEPEIAPVLLRD